MQRASGIVNPAYRGVFVFDNDFPALTATGTPEDVNDKGLLVARSENGTCRVVCFSPRHDLTLGDLPVDAVVEVVDAWADQYEILGASARIGHVQVFENRGVMMGASNPHPHGQIWAEERVPGEVAKETRGQMEHLAGSGCLLCEYAELERTRGKRVVVDNDEALVVVPFWAVWPFETLLIPRQHAPALPGLDRSARSGVAATLSQLTRAYDAVFGVTFPYSAGVHQAPTDGDPHREWHTHVHFAPPLLRSATIRKHMVGYELFAQPQRDLTPEAAAATLRDFVSP